MLRISILIKIVFLSVIISTSAMAKNETRNTYFVLQKVVNFKSNLQSLYDPQKYDLILITDKENTPLITEQQKRVFKSIHILAQFNFNTIKNQILEYKAKSKAPINVKIITNDEYALGLAGHLRDYFKTGEPGFNQVNFFLDKILMKRTLSSNTTISLPKYIHFNPLKYSQSPEKYLAFILNKLNFPIFAKPTNDAGATSTQKIPNRSSLQKWLIAHQNKINFELDEFIDADLYHCDSLIENGNILFVQVSKDNIPCAEFLNGRPNGSIALSEEHDLDDIEKIKTFNKKVLSTLPTVPNGATHLEVFKKKNGEIVFLEIAARTAGAYIPNMYSKYLGINLEEAHFKLQMGLPCGQACQVNKGSYTAWITYPVKKGTVAKINTPILNSKHEITWKIKIGQKLNDAKQLRGTALGILFWNSDYEALKKDLNYLTEFNPYTVND